MVRSLRHVAPQAEVQERHEHARLYEGADGMADISSISGADNGPYRATGIERTAPASGDPGRIEPARREREADSVSLSSAARSAAQADTTEVRNDLVSRVRAELEDGTYVTTDKLDDAVQSLIDEILRGE